MQFFRLYLSKKKYIYIPRVSGGVATIGCYWQGDAVSVPIAAFFHKSLFWLSDFNGCSALEKHIGHSEFSSRGEPSCYFLPLAYYGIATSSQSAS